MKSYALVFFWAGMFGATSLYAQTSEASNQSLDSLVVQARRHFLRGYPEAALPLLNSAVSRYPDAAAGYRWRAQVYAEQGAHEKALGDYLVLLALDSLDREAWFGYGTTLYALERLHEADSAFTKTLALPEEKEAQEIMYRRREGNEGISGMFTLSGLTADVYYQRARTRQALGRNAEAIEDVERALVQSPDAAAYLYLHGVLADEMGDLAQAATSYYECLRQEGSHVGALRGLLALREAVPQATAYLAQLNAAEDAGPMSLAYEGLAYYASGDFALAVERFTAAIDLLPQIPEFYLNRGMAYSQLGKLDRAKADFVAALRLDPEYAKAYAQLASWHFSGRDFPEALVHYNMAIRLNPDGKSYYNRALTQYYLRNLDAACLDLKEAELLGQDIPDQVRTRLCAESK